MSRILINTVTIARRGTTNPRLSRLISRPLGTNVDAKTAVARQPESNPLLTGAYIPPRDTQGVNPTLSGNLYENRRILLSNDILSVKGSETTKNFMVKDAVDKQNQASLEQLTKVAEIMTDCVPRFFTSPHPFQTYTKDMVFIDNIKQTKTQGLARYALKVAAIKFHYSLNHTSAKCEVLNLVKLPEESCIKIRWRIVSRPGLINFMLFFYKFHSTEKWTDGVSTMHVNSDGKIYCHVCDNIDVDESKTEVKKIKNPLVDRGLNV